MIKELDNVSTYIIGDFIVKIIDNDHLRITTNRGSISVKPNSNNCIIVESVRNEHHGNKDK